MELARAAGEEGCDRRAGFFAVTFRGLLDARPATASFRLAVFDFDGAAVARFAVFFLATADVRDCGFFRSDFLAMGTFQAKPYAISGVPLNCESSLLDSFHLSRKMHAW
jgi:hypothetical protein